MNVRALRRFQEALPNDPLVVSAITGTSLQLVSDNITQRVVVLSAVAGLNYIALPKATGSGCTITFVVGKLLTSNSYIIKCSGSDVYNGSVNVYTSAGTAKLFISTANATLTLDGAHQGAGAIGDYIQVWDILSGIWAIDGNQLGTSAVTTPFS